jgi:glycosyltransferase involved in cell wall biosynthesis
MHQHDLLVATSHASETFGIGLVEAQACGLPVIASRFGGFVEVVDEGHTGLFFAPRDAHDLARTLHYVHSHRTHLATMAQSAPAWAAQFAWPVVTNHIESYYVNLLQR